MLLKILDYIATELNRKVQKMKFDKEWKKKSKIIMSELEKRK